ncbi:MAG: NAD(+)/NADH kinase [Myxococcales bacterium]|nr:NAD(+)/NADH kinase [Myxococcales bacterium]
MAEGRPSEPGPAAERNGNGRPRVLVIYKKTAFQRWEAETDPRLRRLLREGDASVAKLRSAHESHLATLELARDALRKLGARATFRHRHEREDEGFDLVVTLGGDGTLLWTSHTVDATTPMVAINSSPETSVGYFCAGDRDEVGELLERALAGELRPTKLTRMRVDVDGEVVHTRVLNDVLFCHECPAATTRMLLCHGGEEVSHACSGVWIGPAAGSTAAQRSAGGKVLPIGSRKLQWIVREPFSPELPDREPEAIRLAKGIVLDGETLRLKSKIREGRLYFDGAQKVARVDVGCEVTFSRSEEPLTLLGLRSRGRG